MLFGKACKRAFFAEWLVKKLFVDNDTGYSAYMHMCPYCRSDDIIDQENQEEMP